MQYYLKDTFLISIPRRVGLCFGVNIKCTLLIGVFKIGYEAVWKQILNTEKYVS